MGLRGLASSTTTTTPGAALPPAVPSPAVTRLTTLSDASSAGGALQGTMGQTDNLRAMASAAGGKADDGSGDAVRSSETEAATVSAAGLETEQVREQAARAAQNVTRAKTELELTTTRDLSSLSEQQANQVQDYRQKALGILGQLNQGRDKISFAKKKAGAEQAGFLMRQTSKQYVETLQVEGKRARLDSNSGFQSALIDTYFKDQQDLLASDLSFRKALAGEKRDFTQWLATMDLDSALAIATGQMQTQATAGQYSAASSLASSGAQAYKHGAFGSEPGGAPATGVASETDLADDSPPDQYYDATVGGTQ